MDRLFLQQTTSAIHPRKTSVQPPFSTIPCNSLYLLANPVLPFLMFSSLSTSFANRSCRLTALNPGSPLPFKVPTCKPSNLQTPHFVSPVPAALTNKSQLIENPATLSPFTATLTRRVKHKSIVCHSYRKHPGRRVAFLTSFVARTEFIPVKPGVRALLRQLTSEKSQAKDPQELKNLAVRPATSHESAVTASALYLPPVTSHQSQVTKSFIIRTYIKSAHKLFRMNTSETQHLKPFRMNTSEKTGVGVPLIRAPRPSNQAVSLTEDSLS